MGKLSDVDQQIIVDFYPLGLSSFKLAKIFRVTKKAILDTLIRHSIKRRTNAEAHTKLSHNKKAFINAEKIPEAAYWIGWLITDGCIYKNVINLGTTDKNIIISFREFLKAEHKIDTRPQSIRAGYLCNEFHRLAINSDELCKQLALYGVVPNKTLTAKVKKLHNNRCFWAGAVLGDGWVTYADTAKKIPRVGICSASDVFLTQFLEYAKSILPETKIKIATNGKNTKRVQFNSTEAVVLLKHLFCDLPFACGEKFNRIQAMIKKH